MASNPLGKPLGSAYKELIALRKQHPDKALQLGLVLVRMLDLDEIVATAGEVAADMLVDEFLLRLRACAREQDIVVSMEQRTCAIIVRGISGREHLLLAASKIERAFEEPVTLIDQTAQIRACMGLSVTSDELAGPAELFRSAATALNNNRRDGTASGFHDSDSTGPVRKANTNESEIAQGLNAGEFELYFQPKVNAAYGTIVGAEALMRWHRSEQRVINPDEFIPIAEASGQIVPLIWFAIKSAIAQCARWPGELSIAVNLPPALLREDDLTTIVTDMLEIHGLPAERLILEITESSVMSDKDDCLAVMSNLRQLGIRFSLDDFGTGHSSLSQLGELPLDELKIDRSFLVGMQKDPHMIKAVVGLAKNYKLKVVAEGVEDADQARRLTQIGCDLLQGYHFGRPMPSLEFRELLNRKVA